MSALTHSAVTSVIVKIASRCNLNCSYCYVYNHEDRSYLTRPKFISQEVFDALLGRIKAYCDRRAGHSISLVFHGGEPTLIGASAFARLAGRARSVLGARLRRLSMQTNGVLLNDAWADVIAEHQVSIGISLDGPPSVHDAARVDHKGRGSYAATMRGLRCLREAGLQPRVLSVVQPGHAGQDVYRHFRNEGIEWMTFLLPDVSHDNKARYYGGLGRTPVADFLVPLFDAWFDEDSPIVVVGIFHDLIKRLLGGRGETDCFGNPLMSYLIVETDGAIEALDALRVCREGIARSNLNVLRDGFDDLGRGLPLVHQAVHQGFSLARACQTCEFRQVCGGGFLPHRYSRARAFDNPSVWCEDIKVLLDHIRRRIHGAAPIPRPPTHKARASGLRFQADSRAMPRVVQLPVLARDSVGIT
jgi:uncharacterized protein